MFILFKTFILCMYIFQLKYLLYFIYIYFFVLFKIFVLFDIFIFNCENNRLKRKVLQFSLNIVYARRFLQLRNFINNRFCVSLSLIYYSDAYHTISGAKKDYVKNSKRKLYYTSHIHTSNHFFAP